MEIFEVTRDVTKDECFWLEKTIKQGTLVYKYNGYTYGCISYSGIAVTLKENKLPFIEIPCNAIVALKEKENGV